MEASTQLRSTWEGNSRENRARELLAAEVEQGELKVGAGSSSQNYTCTGTRSHALPVRLDEQLDDPAASLFCVVRSSPVTEMIASVPKWLFSRCCGRDGLMLRSPRQALSAAEACT